MGSLITLSSYISIGLVLLEIWKECGWPIDPHPEKSTFKRPSLIRVKIVEAQYKS